MSGPSAYQNTLDYLYSFVDFSLTRASLWSTDQFDLTRMYNLMERLGNPQFSYPAIHIAGTKGKGSVAAMCESALRAAGYKTGLYTSPHLHEYTERIQVGGIPIHKTDLVALVDQVRSIIDSIEKLTTFEITTALAFLFFQHEKIDAAVVEVGLGGRLDATNVLSPIVSVITSISYDHTMILGNTLAEIAFEKAGIIKPGIPIVLSPQKPESRKVIEEIARERNAQLIDVGKRYQYSPLERSLGMQSFLIRDVRSGSGDNGRDTSPVPEPVRLEIPLLGDHQVENAATAYAALDEFQSRSLSLSSQAIQQGFANTAWIGRFEILSLDPTVIVDAAHNRDSAQKLNQTIHTYLPERPVTLVFGASEDKDIQGMLEELMPLVDRLILTRSFHPRSADTNVLEEIARPFRKPVHIYQDVVDALGFALQEYYPGQIILATGSLFIAAGVREAWLVRTKVVPEKA